MSNIEYLKNNICTFTPLKDIDYSKKKKLLVMSLFKMSTGGYKDFSKYLDGIKILHDIATERNLEVRIFIDQTIKEDQKIMDYLNGFERVSLILYSCPNFLIGKHHIGLFGTMIRLFPMFNFENNDARYSVIVDGDTKATRVNELIDLYEYLHKKKLTKKLYVAYIGRYFHINVPCSDMYYVHKNVEYYFPYCIAQKIIGMKKMPIKPLVKYCKRIQLYMDDETRPKKILSDYTITEKDYKTKCERNICFGVEEYFLNRIVIKYLLKRDKPFCFLAMYDMAQYNYFKHPMNVNMKSLVVPKNEYTKIYNEYMKRSGLSKYSYDYIDKNVYTHGGIDYDSSTVATPFMREFGHKMTKLLEEIIKEKDNRVYSNHELYSFYSVDYKKYFKLQYIKFLNFDRDIIELGNIVYDK